MKYLIAVLILSLTTVCYADRVCLEKATGKLIEMQSGNVPLGTLTQNAINSGYQATAIEEKYVTAQEWSIIKYNWITKPAQEEAAQKEIIRKQKETEMKAKLKLTDEDWTKLRDALK